MATGAKVGAAGGIMSHPHLGNVQEFHDWDTGPEVDSVWIGFIDMVPVIGTVKEGVELVLALYEGNEAVVKEKEKVIENMVEESLQKHVKVSHVYISSFIQRLRDSTANYFNSPKSQQVKVLI